MALLLGRGLVGIFRSSNYPAYPTDVHGRYTLPGGGAAAAIRDTSIITLRLAFGRSQDRRWASWGLMFARVVTGYLTKDCESSPHGFIIQPCLLSLIGRPYIGVLLYADGVTPG